MKIYVIYIFKIYSGYKCFKIIQICTNLKYVFLFWQDQNSSRTNDDLTDAARRNRAELSVALLTLVEWLNCKMTAPPETTERMRQAAGEKGGGRGWVKSGMRKRRRDGERQSNKVCVVKSPISCRPVSPFSVEHGSDNGGVLPCLICVQLWHPPAVLFFRGTLGYVLKYDDTTFPPRNVSGSVSAGLQLGRPPPSGPSFSVNISRSYWFRIWASVCIQH